MTDSASTTPLVEITGLCKWFGDFSALFDIHLEIASGEKVVVCGPSGSGKSTLIRCINQLEAHQAGTIKVAGREVRPKAYRVQVAIYLAALRALGHDAPDRAQLVYVDAKAIVEVEEEPVEPLVRDFVAAHRGTFEPTPGDACWHCEFSKACAKNGVAVPRQRSLFT